MKKFRPYIIVTIILIAIVAVAIMKKNNSGQSQPSEDPVVIEQVEPTEITSEENSVKDYFMFKENSLYVYTSEDSPLYNQEMFMVYSDETSLEWKIKVDSMTQEFSNLAVLNVDAYDLSFSDNMKNYREPLSNRESNAFNTIISGPIEVGTAWQVNNWSTAEIISVDEEVTVPFGTFKALKIVTNQTDGSYKEEYYAKDIGLIKTVYSTTGKEEMSSSLSEIRENTPMELDFRRFDYNAATDEIATSVNKLAISYNPDYYGELEKLMKVVPDDNFVPLLSENTKINSIKVADDFSLATIDLSKDFLEEVNLGSAIEDRVLTSIAYTIGVFYSADSVLITIDGETYESGHIRLDEPIVIE
ncbi:MAG: GerMN domain-containing protein [Lachnospirales bacterium]